ncbi:hypothetical protein niasHT_032227 [Heterodera trifolii]|uniref:Fucosyltransferase n=1 Tax=Heterodera trifolii TaxID=157864 RepID=A0ABD2HV31_9BILA
MKTQVNFLFRLCCVAFFAIVLLSYLLSFNYDIEFPLRFSKNMPPPPIKKKKMPPILVWNGHTPILHGRAFFMLNRWSTGYPPLSQKVKCPFQCEYTEDRKWENDSSTLIFYLHAEAPMVGWPQHRRTDQSYVMYTAESPPNTLPHFNRTIMTDNWFNATVTYRTDSTVYLPYDRLVRITPDTPADDIWKQEEVLKKVRRKTKLAFQVVSHCDAESGRDLLTKRLSELMPVDLAGPCYKVPCDEPNCYWAGMDSHFFYFAFENSVCPQYVTEKFWKPFRALTVPIVLRRSVLEGLDVPPNAFIAADDFDTVEELADYLTKLRNDTERYLKFFEWTKTYQKNHFAIMHSPFCKLCEFAHRQYDEDLKSTVDFSKHWTTRDCIKGFVQKFLIEKKP